LGLSIDWSQILFWFQQAIVSTEQIYYLWGSSVANPIKLLRVNSTSIQLFFYEFSKLNPIKLFYR
jgi:hypothetical protein